MIATASALPAPRLKCPAAAAYLGLTASALEKMRYEGRGPRYLKIGGRVFYRQTDLDAFLDASVVETTESRARAG
ncbi:hypothetical protein A7D35_20415 [Xanthomonas arboricola]|uniref:helix-turn-helix transcriptional regulator n=1 Tax=Xanthomonas arboricola TaxID=56448 RepID=UPI0007EC8987|nr:helix-turn-helix domain-containing protein [Xanthomonas arboricola]OBR70628.1 hypothetical protein A7D35_20415 [Xanthomonas arboricola]